MEEKVPICSFINEILSSLYSENQGRISKPYKIIFLIIILDPFSNDFYLLFLVLII